MAILGTRCLTDAELELIANTADGVEVQKNSETDSLRNILLELRLLNINMGEATETHFTIDDVEEDCPQ